ncbi:alanine--tRNA ligase [Candidatus Roizmanbacteria bacterium]|nr:alanine--tRNA ligase [Candidatus Roizmanbacteria bacterium]
MIVGHRKLREKFSKFWSSKDHKEIPPIPLVPKDDPTTLFTGSGMQQLVPYLLGEPHPLGKRLYNIQPCFRSQDIDEVGDNRHTTFFEMMGNWSLGTYFKEEQLEWVWDFFTDELDIPKHKLYVTVFSGTKTIPRDNESASIWKKLGVKENHIFYYGPEKNWWSRAGIPDKMPVGEPGGPDSEIFHEFTQVAHNPKYGSKCHPNCDCGKFLEIGNSVFMQYQKQKDGSFKELPKKNVDFGGGLERILAALNNNPDVFKTDIFSGIYDELHKKIGKETTDVRVRRLRIFLDHTRAILFLIKDNVKPGKNERDYVLRRLIRRSDDQLNILFQGDRILIKSIWKSVITYFIAKYKNTYKLNLNSYDVIEEELNKYQNVFVHLEKERSEFQSLLKKYPISTASTIAGPITFNYQSTFGIPFDTSRSIAEEVGLDTQILIKNYNKKKIEHQSKSRTSSSGMFKGGLADHSDQVLKYHTATHLLHQALFDVLGDSVRQEGSNITAERLRFDFSAPKKMSPEELREVELIINKKIKEKIDVSFKIMNKDDAYKIGARAFFREKYPEKVKIYFIGDYSKEF